MERIFAFFFTAPQMPDGLLMGGLNAIGKAFELAYKAGVKDGFFAGALFVLILTIRRRGS